MSFKPPKGWEQYYKSVEKKTRQLMVSGIWDELEELDLNRWLTNFSCDESKYLAACMLDALSYRSRKMCQSMMRNILIEKIPRFCRINSIGEVGSILDWKDSFSRGEPLVRFVPVSISDGKVKSSSVVVREFIEANNIPQRCVQQPENIKKAISNGTRLIVFLDDFCGSGYQFNKFIKQKDIESLSKDVRFIYCPLAAHVDGISRIETKYPFIKVVPVEILTKTNEFFYTCDRGYFRGDMTNSLEDAKDFYKSYCGERFENSKYLMGMSSQSLTYSFFFSCPNNNLKALYHEQGKEWKRLLFRGKS